jgi:hypothetical protein
LKRGVRTLSAPGSLLDFGLNCASIVIACPSCKRRIFTRRDILYAPLDGTARCRACGKFARLDMFSRWILSSLLALTLPALFLSGGVFYSGHILLLTISLVLAAWRVLAWAAFPLLSLEHVAAGASTDRRHSMIIVGALLAAAIALDGFIASRFEPDDALDEPRPASAVHNHHK